MRTLPCRAAVALSISIVAAGVASGQPSPYRMRELAPGVHVIQRDVPPNGAADPNVLIIVNDEDVVVVDANIFPASARQAIAEIKKLTSKPVRYLINTHWHSDHHYGNAAYREAYPGVEIVQHVNTRVNVITRDKPDLVKNLETEYPAVVARYRKALETGRTSRGDSVTPEMRKDFSYVLGMYQFFLDDMKSTPLVPGTLVIQDSLVLHRGERTIVVKYLGKGNTDGDLVVSLPKERIVATGDLVVHPVPYAFYSHLREWPATLRALERIDATTIVPGHGEVLHDWSYVDRLIPMIESTWKQVEQSVAKGNDLEATMKAVNLDAFRASFGGTDATARREFDGLFLQPGVEAAYKELRPEAAKP